MEVRILPFQPLKTNKGLEMLKAGNTIKHHTYGYGLVLQRYQGKTSPIVLIKWDNPELARFPEDKLPYEYESFWTEEDDLDPQ